MHIWVYFCKILFPSSCKNMTCNNAFDRDKTALFSFICDFWFNEFEMMKLTLNQDYLSILDPILIWEYSVINFYML